MSTGKIKTAPVAVGDARRAARLAAVQTLYQIEYGQELSDGMHLDEGQEGHKFHNGLMKEILLTVQDRRTVIDEILSGSLDTEWSLERLEVILRAILRAGVAELIMSTKTPTALLISDYVDVAHAFFGGKEPGLVNAVLDRVAKKVRT